MQNKEYQSILRRCPFCGGEAQVNERYRSGTPNRKMYWVSCKACGISQQNTNVSGYRYQSKAIDRWNRREPMNKIVEQLEELISYNKERSRMYDGHTHYDSEIMGISKAIEIVKSGGAV